MTTERDADAAELDSFNGWAARWMRRRLDEGGRKFGALSWRRETYSDNDNVARLYRAVEHLVGVLAKWRDPATAEVIDASELGKRAADVANQAFMLADLMRREGMEPFALRAQGDSASGYQRADGGHLDRQRDSATTEGAVREAAAAYMAHVQALACDHGTNAGTHTSCPEALALQRALLADVPDEGEGLERAWTTWKADNTHLTTDQFAAAMSFRMAVAQELDAKDFRDAVARSR